MYFGADPNEKSDIVNRLIKGIVGSWQRYPFIYGIQFKTNRLIICVKLW